MEVKNYIDKESGEEFPPMEKNTPARKAQNTPTPWKAEIKYPPMGGMVWELSDANNDNILKIRGGCIPTAQDAAFIVRAVNSHEALLEMIYRLLPYMEDLKESDQNAAYKTSTIDKIEKEMLALIKQAEDK